jgi:hypothetical protein
MPQFLPVGNVGFDHGVVLFLCVAALNGCCKKCLPRLKKKGGEFIMNQVKNFIVAFMVAVGMAIATTSALATTPVDDLFASAQTDVAGLSTPYKALLSAIFVIVLIGIGWRLLKRGGKSV